MKRNVIKNIYIQEIHNACTWEYFFPKKNQQSSSLSSSWLLALRASLHLSQNLVNSLSSLHEFVSHSFHQFSFPLKNDTLTACSFSPFHSSLFVLASCSQFNSLSHFFLPKKPLFSLKNHQKKRSSLPTNNSQKSLTTKCFPPQLRILPQFLFFSLLNALHLPNSLLSLRKSYVS